MSAAEGLRDPMIEGVIMSPLTLDPRSLAHRGRSLPLVLLGERDYDGPCDHVMFDNIEASLRLTEHLLGQGYQRIAVIGRQDDPPHATAVKRLKGYQKALRRGGVKYQRELAPVVSGAPYSKAPISDWPASMARGKPLHHSHPDDDRPRLRRHGRARGVGAGGTDPGRVADRSP